MFPSNSFKQELASDQEVADFIVENFGSRDFVMIAERTFANGAQAHPVLKYLKDKTKPYLLLKSIKWNFTKFLIDHNGQPVIRIGPNKHPDELRPYLDEIKAKMGK